MTVVNVISRVNKHHNDEEEEELNSNQLQTLQSPTLSSMSPHHPIDDSSISDSNDRRIGVLPFLSSWLLRTRRAPRYILLLICSPILIPLVCLTFPLICFAELCIRICLRRRGRELADAHHVRIRQRGVDEDVEDGGEVGLLQRYLEDQLSLVRSVYECGDDAEEEGDFGIRDFDFFAAGQPPLLIRSN